MKVFTVYMGEVKQLAAMKFLLTNTEVIKYFIGKSFRELAVIFFH